MTRVKTGCTFLPIPCLPDEGFSGISSRLCELDTSILVAASGNAWRNRICALDRLPFSPYRPLTGYRCRND